MKSAIISLLIILSASFGFIARADEPGALIAQADSAYTSDDYARALDLYRQAADSCGTSAKLWYNIGNTYYRLGNPGMAIVAYERALRLDPSDADARTNLEFVNSRLTDRPGDKGSFMSNSLDSVCNLTTADTWAWCSFVIFCLMMGSIAIYIFGNSVTLRKAGFFAALVLLALTVAAIVVTLRSSSLMTSRTEAVITARSTILSTSPREPKDRTEEAMLLHEGTKVSIIDSVSAPGDSLPVKWYDVKVDNSHRAWIRSTDIEKI